MVIIDGKRVAETLRHSLVKDLPKGTKPKLGILCPDLPPSLMYMGAQVKLAESLGFETEVVCCKADTTQEYAESVLREWNISPDVHGIFILQPFIEGIDLERLLMLINPLKDVECIHPYDSALRYFSKSPVGSCTAMAIMEILDWIGAGSRLAGMNAVVVGESKIVGRPVSMLLLDRGATVTICHKATSDRGNLKECVERAELLVVAVGKPEFIPGTWIRKDSIVIDVGVNRIGGKIVGDVEFEVAAERVSHITPAHGGVGPVTAMVGMRQLVMACKLQHDRRSSL